jgi:hypothetical protein
MRNAYKILVMKLEENRPFGRLNPNQDNIKMVLIEKKFKDTKFIGLF